MTPPLLDSIGRFLVNRSVRRQLSGPPGDLSLWGLKRSDAGEVTVAGIPVTALAREYGSPLLVVNREQLVADARSLQDALGRVGTGARALYSYKTNCTPGILQVIHAAGIGAEVVSPYELWLAEQLRVPGDKIVYNGVNKTEESLVSAVEYGLLAINIDSLSEIERIAAVARRLRKKARVGLRLGFLPKSQFGVEVPSGEAMEACDRIARHREFLDFTCIHFCVTSNARYSDTHRHFARQALEFCGAVKERTGMTIRQLDVGGGIGVPTSRNLGNLEYGLYRLFGNPPPAPDPRQFEPIDMFIERLAEEICRSCTRLSFPVPELLVEPGRFVTSRGEFLISTVLEIKEKKGGTPFVITDAGRLSTTFPCEFEYHEMFRAEERQGEELLPYHIMGRICTSADWQAKNRVLPRLREGDLLLTMDAGAYFSSYSTNFAFPRPGIVMAEAGEARMIRMTESYEHLTTLDLPFRSVLTPQKERRERAAEERELQGFGTFSP